MKSVKTTGFVIRTTTVGDYNKMITLISPGLGKISVWCKGVKSLKNKSAAACALLCYGEFVLTKKGEVYTLSQASVIESFYNLRKSVKKLAYAMYFAEVAGAVTQEMMASGELLKLLLNTLYYLEREKKPADQLRVIYELRLVCCCGFAPCVSCCTTCGSEAAWFDMGAGGAVCSQCKGEGTVPISTGALSLMRFYIEGGLASVLSKDVDISFLPEVLKISEGFLRFCLDRKIQTLDYLKKVLSDPLFE